MNAKLWKEKIANYWEEEVNARLWKLRFKMEDMGAKSAHGFIGAMAFLPVFQMAQQGDSQALVALAKMLSDLGTGTLSNMVETKLLEDSESIDKRDVVTRIEDSWEASPQFREELNLLLEKLGIISMYLEGLSEEDQQLFDQMWTAEKGLLDQMPETKNITTISGNIVKGNINTITGNTFHGGINL